MTPNLFTIATKELSQDAFITWLLQWADPCHEAKDKVLHQAAMDFLQTLISLQNSSPEKISKVVAGRQWENIDIWAEVNDNHLLIIEDKTGTKHHSEQLSRYRATAQKWCNEHNAQLTCVYLKTQSESASSFKTAEKENYAVFKRSDFLRVLNRHDVENDIYKDFRTHLQNLEDAENEFHSLACEKWVATQWVGLYQALEDLGTVESWGYVPNQTGGFWNAILGGASYGDMPVYLQIEQGQLCFKVGEVHEDRANTRNYLHSLLMENTQSDMPIQRPSRFGSGVYMTVAVTPMHQWIVSSESGHIDVNRTAERLNSYKSWLCGLINTKSETSVLNSTCTSKTDM